MMEQDEEKILSRKRLEKWIKIFLIFLAFMWLCTIISRSIYVSKLPQVKTELPLKRYIEHIVEADGIVTAGGEVAVNTLSGLRIEKINVQQGDAVKSGDVLFTIDTADLKSIIAAKETELTKLQLQLADAEFNQILGAQKKEIALLWAQEDYDSADKETALAVQRAQEALSKAQGELQKHLGTSAPHTSDEDRENAWNRYNTWKKQGYELQDTIAEKERTIAELEEKLSSTINHKTEDAVEDSSMESSNTENNGDEENTDTNPDIREQLEKEKEELVQLQSKLAELERNPVAQPDYSAEEIAYDAWQSEKASLEDAVQSARQALEDARLARENALRQKMRDIASAQTLSNADSGISVYELEIADLQTELAKLYDILQKKGSITAENDGFISNIQIDVGGRTTDSASMLLADLSTGGQFKFSISKEQAKYIHLNDSVELKLNGEQSMEVTADYFTENNTGGYDMICRLPAETGQPGISGRIRKSVQGEQHSLTVPVEAVYEESGTFYIYILNEKTGILGNEYYAEKIKVQIADRNDKYAAVSEGTISEDTQVIIFSSEELKQGANIKIE
ncbi:MAG: biotin/lipoyl-binding protein [Lachnospiraceae bacterium]|nr:biotin/lipoyl-binding protein [Lachnospiraceae bacterium]